MPKSRTALKRLHAVIQGWQIEIGERLVAAFPFLLPPAERAVERLLKWEQRWEAKRGKEPAWVLVGAGIGLVILAALLLILSVLPSTQLR